MELRGKVEELVNKYLENPDLFIVEIVITGGGNMKKILILLDGDKGVTIAECASVSRRLGAELEELNIIDSPYLLEVSSAGLDQPLKLKRQYFKNKGRRLSIIMADESLRTGKLEEVKEDSILISAEEKEKKSNGKPGKKIVLVPVEIPFSDIKKSSVLVSFN
jgi:ribosome maturation factor RimP